MSSQEEVRNASRKFYEALNRMANGDAGSLSEVWSHGTAVTTMHPIAGRQVGWNEVRESFEKVAGLASEGRVELKDQLIRVVGDLAYEVGVEQGRFKLAGDQVTVEHRVTNIYEREGGAWKLVHHHTDLSPAMMEVLGRLQAQAKKAGKAA
jgi:ketosteroid isomerase-like protein